MLDASSKKSWRSRIKMVAFSKKRINCVGKKQINIFLEKSLINGRLLQKNLGEVAQFGRGRATGNRVTVKSGSRVRISSSPPKKMPPCGGFSFGAKRDSACNLLHAHTMCANSSTDALRNSKLSAPLLRQATLGYESLFLRQRSNPANPQDCKYGRRPAEQRLTSSSPALWRLFLWREERFSVQLVARAHDVCELFDRKTCVFNE